MDNEEYLYNWIFKGKNKFPRWHGNKILKYPTDLILYHQIIWDKRPDLIVETGTAYGGSTLFLADMLDIIGKGLIVSIDYKPVAQPPHPRIKYITGRTTSKDVLNKVRELSGYRKTTMVILDSDHRRPHVKRELYHYSPIVTPGQYMVVEDAWYKGQKKGPAQAIDWFIRTSRGKQFELTKIDDQFRACLTRGGWLIKK